jgi:peptidoglycan hydrolase-like amidase
MVIPRVVIPKVIMDKEPVIRVGVMTGAREVKFVLSGSFTDGDGVRVREGAYTAWTENSMVNLQGETALAAPVIKLTPTDFESCCFTVHGVKIGLNFHWEREESQQFQGDLIIEASSDGLIIINRIPIESYLVSVISSEMSASCPAELLRAHAIVSRSWLLAQLSRDTGTRAPEHSQAVAGTANEEEIIRWYDRQSHSDFDVCADDHCQRYQGISKAFSQAAFDAVSDTRGRALVYGGEVCDARYSKSCGAMTETYSAVWDDKDVPYLKPIYDGPGNEAPGHRLPLSVEVNAEDWIVSTPVAYCGLATPELLGRILPGFDQETRDFYRWQVDYTQQELTEILLARLGVDFGRVHSLLALERGESGRIIKLRIVGEKRTLVIGKELEIRRALSRSHLYSSAFVTRAAREHLSDYPARFNLIGAGWGHGVGLCQIGAAVMADRGHGHEEILSHYFTGATMMKLY